MTEIIKETTVATTQSNNSDNVDAVVTTPVWVGATNSQTYEYLVYYFFGALEVLLVFRLLLKLIGANYGGGFVTLIYGITRPFILPFEGMFRRFTSQGVETASVLEPSTLVAIIVYSILAVGIVKLIRISSGEVKT